MKDIKSASQQIDEDGATTTESLSEAELQDARLLYSESATTLRFVKNHQWKTVGATLLTYFGILVLSSMTDADQGLAAKMMGIIILLACSVIFTLIIYQFWAYNEMKKIELIDSRMSALFRDVRALKSKKEGNWHRYLLLGFMIAVVILGGLVAHHFLDQIVLNSQALV